MRILEDSYDIGGLYPFARIFSDRPYGYKRYTVLYEDGRQSMYSGLWYKLRDIQKIVEKEIDRTKSHFKQIQSSIISKELSGKKINFILQEINRESNTILSKFLNKKIAKNAISLKILTEKLREQINNIL